MKNNYKTQMPFSFFILTLLLLPSIIVKGQEASANWPLTSENNQSVISGNIIAAGPLPTGFKAAFGSDYYTIYDVFSNDLNPDKYVQFEIEPIIGYDLEVKEFSLNVSANSINAIGYVQILSSLSADFSDNQIIAPEFSIDRTLAYHTFAFNQAVPDGTKLYFRIYPYGYLPEVETFNVRMANLTIKGFTSQKTSITYEKDEWCTSDGTAEVTVTGTEGGTFSSSTELAVNPTTGSIDLENCEPGSYTVNYTFSGEVIASTGVTIHPPPECTVYGTEGPVCPSSTISFSAPEGISFYSWSVSGNATITGSTNAQDVNVETGTLSGSSFTLSLTTEDENGCTSTCLKEINVEEAPPGTLPTATLTGTQSVCYGASADLVVNLTGQSPWTFTWTDEVSEHIVQTYDPQYKITVTPLRNTSYSLKGMVTDGNGYSNAATGEVKIYTGPITIVPNLMACPNTTIEVPVTVKSFSEVRDISLTLRYDPEVMIYRGFENGDITFGEGEIGDILVNDNAYGDYRVLFISKFSDENLPALEDDAELLRLKFDYIGGDTQLEWIDSPDDSWCSYSFQSVLDETGFETEDFCDTPTVSYYISGSIKQLIVSDTDISPVPDVSTITGTPVIIPVSVRYPDIEAQQIPPDVMTDLKISYDGTGIFPLGASINKIYCNGHPLLSSPFNIGNRSELLLSEIPGIDAASLLDNSNQTIKWEFFIDGILSPQILPVNIEALAYTDLNECLIVLDTEPFTISFSDAALSVTESVAACGTEPFQFTAEIVYPDIINLDTSVKADARISAETAFPEGTMINWSYNNSTSGTYTLPVVTDELMLSAIVGALPNPLSGHSGMDGWSFEISNAGLMANNDITIEAVALLDGEYYVHSQDHVTITVNSLPAITALSLQTSTDQNSWETVSGDLSSGYAMCADPAEAYHYLHVETLTTSKEISSNFENSAFYLDVNSVPAGYFNYWDSKGVNELATDGWQAVMWDIINGETPMFYIGYNDSEYNLIDGLQYHYSNITGRLRISGDYPAGSYIFEGTVKDVNGCTSEAFTVSLHLSSSPVITCPGDIEEYNEPGNCGAAVSFAATATGNPAPDIVYQLPDGTQITSGYFFPVGTTQVTAFAENDCNTVECTFSVTIIDNEVPEINCPVSESLEVMINSASTYVHSGTGWDANVKDNCPGKYILSFSLSGATTGTGNTLDEVSFNLGTTKVSWMATDAAGNKNDCEFTVTVSGVALTGKVMYYNKEHTPLDDVTVTLRQPDNGTEVATTTTNKGEYSFLNLCPGVYNVNFMTDKAMRSINSTDAGQVNAWNVAQSDGVLPSIEKVRFLSGDVSGDNWIIVQDAGMIQNYFLTLGTEVTFDKPWEFWKANEHVTSQPQTNKVLQVEIPEESSGTIQDFYGLVSGDFNRSNIPASSNINSLAVKSAVIDEGLVTLFNGDTLIAEGNGITELTIRAASSMQVGAISLILNFPADRIKVMDVYLKDEPNQPAGFNVMGNMLIIGWNSVIPLSVKAGEPLLTLSLQINGEKSEKPVFFELASNPLNELANEDMIAIDNASLIMDGLLMKEIITGIEITENSGLKLACWPNPFGDRITFGYTLPSNGNVTLEIRSISGSRINILQNKLQTAGEHLEGFSGSNLVPGVYHVVLRFTDQAHQSKETSTIIIKQ